MDIAERKREAELRFEKLRAKREDHLSAAASLLEEMNRLQGEYRAYTTLLESDIAEEPEVNVKDEGEVKNEK